MSIRNSPPELPLPAHYDLNKVGQVWRVPYEQRAADALRWAREHSLQPASQDEFKIALIGIDIQNTFCIPDYELFVGGRSGMGAVEDNRRLVEFIYRNLGAISEICVTMDTHQLMQIFHSLFLVAEDGAHPAPYTLITFEDIQTGRWKFNSQLAGSLGIKAEYGQRLLQHYTQELMKRGKYELTIWPYHAMLGGIGHALVSAVEEAIFFHSVARSSQPDFAIKGQNPLTEHYSAIGPEVLRGPDGSQIAEKSDRFIKKLMTHDALVIAGQAKSHCVAWTVEDLLEQIRAIDPSLANRVYLLEDCTSPVVVPGAVDYTEQAEATFQRFAEAGMRRVHSTEPIAGWPGMHG